MTEVVQAYSAHPGVKLVKYVYALNREHQHWSDTFSSESQSKLQ